MAEPVFFPYRRDKRWAALFAVLRLEDDDGVTLIDDTLRATFGRVSIETPLTNVSHTQQSGPHRWYTAVGLRLSFTDDGITFGTNHVAGLCIEFVEKVPKVLGFKDHSALWVSVADPAGLADAIDSALEQS